MMPANWATMYMMKDAWTIAYTSLVFLEKEDEN
jgi:hypothetical protein